MAGLLIWIFLFLISQPVLAAFSFSIDSVEPTAISSKEQSVTVHLTLSDLPTGDSYLRVAWQESDGKPYFGYMQNNAGDWVQIKPLSSDCKGYFKVSDSAEVATLSAKIGEDTEINPGTFILKAHRFASACSYSSVTPTANISVVFPTSTPTPAPTFTPAPTATPTPENTPTPTPTKIPAPMKTPTLILKFTPTPLATSSASPVVLGADDPPATTSALDQKRPLTPYIISTALVGLGFGILSITFILKK